MPLILKNKKTDSDVKGKIPTSKGANGELQKQKNRIIICNTPISNSESRLFKL